MHRLVHDFARRAMTAERRGEALREALEWINPAFVGDPWDVRTWPVLDPLAPHALAVAHRADEIGIAEPTAQLFGTTGLLFHAKARYAEAEPLLPRAMAPLGGILPPELRGKSHANIRLVPGKSLKRLLQGAAVGVVATLVVGFGWGGWMLGSSAKTLADSTANSAVVAAIAPICVDQFQRSADAANNLTALKKTDAWQQATFVEKAVGR